MTCISNDICSARVASAHACSQIGLKWYLFVFYDLRKVLVLLSVLISLINYLPEQWQKCAKLNYGHFLPF